MSIAFCEFGGAYILVCDMINILVSNPDPDPYGGSRQISSMLHTVQIPRKVPLSNAGSVAVPGKIERCSVAYFIHDTAFKAL